VTERSLGVKAVGALLVVGLLVAGGLFLFTGGDLDYQTPTVESIESEFGEASPESTAVRTDVVVDNPNERPLPAAASVRYEAHLNGVRVASGSRSGVSVPPGRSTIEVEGTFDNRQVPAWWVTHVNGGERSELVVSPRVSVAGVVDRQYPNRTTVVETDLLGALAQGDESTVTLADRDVLVVSNRTASWGTADAERTPVTFAVDLRNVHDRPVRLDGTAYRVVMNGVVVGEGTTEEGIELAPGESGTVRADAALDTPKMQAWWVTHVRQNETTNLSVEVYGLVEKDGERRRLPLNVFDRRLRFETRILGDGETTATPVPSDGTGAQYATPEVLGTDSRWGAVREDTTEVVTTVSIDNPNGEAYTDLLTLTVDQRTRIGEVVVAENTSRVDELPTGVGNVTVTAPKQHSTVPRWWASHVNNGERSRVRTTVTGVADVGLTTLPVALPDRNGTVETDVAAQLSSDEPSAVEQDGRTVATVVETDAEWASATPERGEITMRVTVRNEQTLSSLNIRDVNYTVALNEVRLADRRELDRTFEIPPGTTRTLEFTVVLDHTKMAEWWPTHVRNGERSRLDTRAHATVEAGGRSERVAFDFLGSNEVIETDVLADDGESGRENGNGE
jgi:LEA14-like dessication related protein